MRHQHISDMQDLGWVTCRQEADVVQEGVVDHKGVQGIQAGMVHCGHQDVLVTLAAGHKPHVSSYGISH